MATATTRAGRRDRPIRARPLPYVGTDDRRRFIQKVERDPSDCWLWTGATTADGYGRFRLGAHVYPAHRVAWTIRTGVPFPVGRVADHLCGNRRCVNPDHVEPVWQGENVRRGIEAARNAADASARRRRALTWIVAEGCHYDYRERVEELFRRFGTWLDLDELMRLVELTAEEARTDLRGAT